MSIGNKPDTMQSPFIRGFIKRNLLSNHLRIFPKNEKTLDIGCGWGFSLKINKNFYCVDADKACISHLQSIGASAFLVDISKSLPFDDGFFDNAFTHDVCEHLDEEEMLSLFREARRVIRPGGLFMNVVPNRKGYLMGLDPKIGHKRFVQLDEIESTANITGFKLVKSWHSPLPSRWSEFFVHNKLITVCKAV